MFHQSFILSAKVVGPCVIYFLDSNYGYCPPPSPCSVLSLCNINTKTKCSHGWRLNRRPDGIHRCYWNPEESIDKPRPGCVRHVGGGRRRRGRTSGGNEKHSLHRYRYKIMGKIYQNTHTVYIHIYHMCRHYIEMLGIRLYAHWFYSISQCLQHDYTHIGV